MIKTRIFSNNAKTALATSISSGTTSITVVDGSKFPNPGPNEYFSLTIDSGASIEIVEVHAVSGNTFSSIIRGREGTSAQAFSSGTRVENRVTAETMSQLARLVDRMADISSVDSLDTVTNSPSNSYLCQSPDDSGTPIVAIEKGTMWRFLNHPVVTRSGSSASNGTTLRMPLASANSIIPVYVYGSYIIQFTSGNNAGLARIIQSTTSGNVFWATALPNIVSSGDSYEIYESSAVTMSKNTAGEDALIYSIVFGD